MRLKSPHRIVDSHPMRVGPLRVAAFRRLATTYTLNELCWSFGTIALAVAVYDRTGSALASTALFLATTFLPAFVAPALTARLDTLPVRRALPGLYLVEALLFGALAALAGRAPLDVLLVLALADGAVAIVGRALTRAAVVAALEPAGMLADGNKLLNVGFSLAFATGPAIAGLVVAVAGAGVSLAVTAALFATMAFTLATARSLPAASGAGDRSWRTRLRQGIAFAAGEPVVRAVLGAHGAAAVFLSFGMPIEVVYVRESLGASDAVYGLLLAAWGAGTVLSSIALARVRATTPLVLIPAAAAAMGAGYGLLAVSPVVALAVVGCLIGGAGNGLYYVSVVQAIQERVAEDFQARVMSLLESVTALGCGAGFILGGTLTALMDARIAFAVAAGGVLVSAAAIRLMLRERTSEPAVVAAPRAAAPEPVAAG
jgi:predicted MFS family arabinose efflux permease